MSNDGQDKQERPERQPERQTSYEKRAQGEVNANVSDYTEKVIATRLEKKLSGNSGVTGQIPDKNGKGLASAKDLLGDDAHGLSKKEKQSALLAQVEKDGYIVGKPKDEKQEAAKAERLEQVEKNYHRDIARQIKDAIKGTPHHDKSEAQAQSKQVSEKPKEIKLPVQAYQIAHPEAAPIDISPAVQQAKTDVIKSVRQDINTFWKPTENAIKSIMDMQQGHLKESDGWADVDLKAASEAYKAFPSIKEHGIPESMIGGIILNEVRHSGDPRDPLEDFSVKNFGTVRNLDGSENTSASVGPAQMQIANIRNLVKNYPQLKDFADDPVRAACDPKAAPFFVAAYMADKIKGLENHNRLQPKEPINITPATIAYTYNPDVFSKSGEYRAKTPSEKVESSLGNKHAMDGWKPERLPFNEQITSKSTVVADILEAMKAVEKAKR